MSGLYDGWIVDHGRSPRNVGPLPDATHEARRDNPFCGDRVTVQLRVEGTLLVAAAFQARACAICTAAASLLTTLVVGLTRAEAAALAEQAAVAVEDGAPEPSGALAPLADVRVAPSRRRCATLPFEALAAALEADFG